MKNLLILIVSLFIISFQAFAQDSFVSETTSFDTSIVEAVTTELTVEIHGLDSDEGTLMIAIYGSEGQWLSQPSFRKSSDIRNGTATVVFDNIPVGIYGISTYHDENNNSKLDTGLFGIPSEPYASSRGAKGMFGPPKWNDAKFKVSNVSHKEEIKF